MAYSIFCKLATVGCGYFDIRQNDVPAAVQVAGMCANQCVLLQRQAHVCTGYTTVYEADCVANFTTTRTVRPITVPGQYRLLMPCTPTCSTIYASLSKGSDHEGL